MSKKYLIIVLVLLAMLLAGGGYYWKTKMQKPITVINAGVVEDMPKTALPTIDTSTANPAENIQSADPYEKTNPFSNIKTNPFE